MASRIEREAAADGIAYTLGVDQEEVMIDDTGVCLTIDQAHKLTDLVAALREGKKV